MTFVLKYADAMMDLHTQLLFLIQIHHAPRITANIQLTAHMYASYTMTYFDTTMQDNGKATGDT